MRRLNQWLWVVMCMPLVAHAAGIEADLDSLLGSIGGGAQVNDANVYKSQDRTYINGGDISVRLPNRPIQIASFTGPHYSAGCGGIDFHAGGLNFMSKDEMVQTLRAIGANMGSYAFMLGLRTISPQIENTIERINTWMQKINGLASSTCEAAAWAVDSIASKGEHSKEESLCIMHRMENSNDSYEEAMTACNVGGGQRAAATNSDEVKKEAFINGNLAWMVMVKNHIFDTDKEMREFLMSITGTIIKDKVDKNSGQSSTSEDAVSKSEPLRPSLIANDDKLLDAILNGGNNPVDVYQCQGSDTTEFGCKSVAKGTVTISPDHSMVGQIRQRMQEAYDSIKNKQNPQAATLDFVYQTKAPVYKIVSTAAMLGGDTSQMLLSKYSKGIAAEVLFDYVSQLLYLMEGELQDETYGKDGERLRENIRMVRQKIADRRIQVHHDESATYTMMRELQFYQQVVLSGMPNPLAQANAWGAAH